MTRKELLINIFILAGKKNHTVRFAEQRTICPTGDVLSNRGCSIQQEMLCPAREKMICPTGVNLSNRECSVQQRRG